MAFVRNTLMAGDRIVLTKDVVTINGTFEKGTEMTLVAGPSGWTFTDNDGHAFVQSPMTGPFFEKVEEIDHPYDAILDDWQVLVNFGIVKVYGRLSSKDKKGRFNIGDYITTSSIKAYQSVYEGVIIETNNTKYLLGKAKKD